MFFTKENRYTNAEIDQSLEEKGFSVYNYISLEELLMTVQRDYLWILSVINIPFWIATIVLWVMSYASGSFWFLFLMLFWVYFVIFLVLLFKLIVRSFHFLKISNVVYTRKGIILWDVLHQYGDSKSLDKKLWEYEEMFDEYLAKPSKLKQVIIRKRQEVLWWTAETGKKVLDVMGRYNIWDDAARLAIPVMISYWIYAILLYTFYYLGYFFWIVMFYAVYIFLKAILLFKENTEIKMKKKIEYIDEGFVNMKKIDKILSHKIAEFGDGEISKIASFVEENFKNFYTEIWLVLSQRKSLLKVIEKSEFKDFIDFEMIEEYIKNSFNKPVKEMILLLSKTEKMLINWINEIKNIDGNAIELDASLSKKELVLSHQLEVLQHNKSMLEKNIIN